MTKHAMSRLTERFPDYKPSEALKSICAYIDEGFAEEIAPTAAWEANIYQCILPNGEFVYPIRSNSGEIITVLSEGMTAEAQGGKITLNSTSMPTETVGGLEIRVPRKNEKVTEDGAYRISMARYHSQSICPGPSVSSTAIRKAVKSPREFWKTFEGNPERYPEPDISDSLTLGRAAHCLLLGDEVFDEHFIYVPSDAPQRPTATQIKAFERDGVWSESAAPRAKFWDEFDARAKGRLLLKEEMVERIKYMAESLRESPEAVTALTSELTEISMIWQDNATGLWIKSRPDCIPTNGYDFGDLKTFASKGGDVVRSSERSTDDYEYPMQMALAVEGAERTLYTTAKSCMLVFIQTTKPFETIPLLVDEDTLYWARVLNRSGIDAIAHGLATGEWPGAAKGVKTFKYPEYKLHRLAEMQRTGELPNI